MSDFNAKMHQIDFNFGWGSAPDPAGEAYSAPSDPLAGFKGLTSKMGGKGGSGWRGWVSSTFFSADLRPWQ